MVQNLKFKNSLFPEKNWNKYFAKNMEMKYWQVILNLIKWFK